MFNLIKINKVVNCCKILIILTLFEDKVNDFSLWFNLYVSIHHDRNHEYALTFIKINKDINYWNQE